MLNIAILAHGKNWELPVPPNSEDIRLSIESEITAEAAGELFTSGIGDLIIFSTGHTAGTNYPSEATKMREAMYEHFSEGEVPLSKTVLEEDSYDTITNLRNVKERMTGLGVDKVILLSIGYHLPRVKRLAEIAGVPVSQAFKSDYLLAQKYGINHLYGRRVLEKSIAERSPKPLARTVASYGLECVGWGLAVIDPRAEHVAKLATRKIRHQA